MQQAGSGLAGSIRRLLATLTELASTRLELLANELYEERLRLERMLLYFFVALFCIGLGVLLLTLLVVALLWDQHRLLALGGLGTLFLGAGLLVAVRLYRLSQARTGLFSQSLAELGKDRERLSEHG